MTPDPSDGPPGGGRRAGPRWLLALPMLALGWPPFYNRVDPAVLGVPFFYAYQLAMIPLALVCMLVVHRARRR